MWDKPHLLRMVSNSLVAISLLLVGYGVVRYVLQLPIFPLRAIELASAPRHVDMDQLNRVVKSGVRGGFFSVDLEQTRRSFEQLPWVRKVSVRRKFPWRLEVNLEEHVALARWNSSELVDTHGEVFAAQTSEALPSFVGQPASSQMVTEMYGALDKQLDALGQHITQISLSPRFDWQIRLEDGIVLELGREQVRQRMERFVTVYPYSLATYGRTVKYVDLRYRNGFAAYLPEGGNKQAGQGSGKRV